MTISKVADVVKSNSSRWIKTKGAEFADFHWQNGYGAFSVSPSHRDQLKVYIQNQEEHHKIISFQDEYRKLLKKYSVDFDENYVWD